MHIQNHSNFNHIFAETMGYMGAMKYWIVQTFLRLPVVKRWILLRYMDSNPLAKEEIICDIPNDGIFIMYEPRFSKIVSLLKKKEVPIGYVSRRYFDLAFKYCLKEYNNEAGRNYGEYALQTYSRHIIPRKRYLNACKIFAQTLRAYTNSPVILLPKFNDDYTLELIEGFKCNGWKVIVYDREGTVTPERLEKISPVVARIAPTCDVIVTYNSSHKDFFKKVFSLGSQPIPKLVMLGNPSTDVWFDNSIKTSCSWPKTKGRNILFFAFGEFSYVYDYEYLKGRDQVWRSLLEDIHGALEKHLISHPNDTLIYKRGPKQDRDYWSGSENLLKLPNAILVDPNESASSLIAGADIVIAFQTTAIIDAMHTSVPIVYCGWGETYNQLKDSLIDFEGMAKDRAIHHAASAIELNEILVNPLENINPDILNRAASRNKFTLNPDGCVSRKFVDWLISENYVSVRSNALSS